MIKIILFSSIPLLLNADIPPKPDQEEGADATGLEKRGVFPAVRTLIDSSSLNPINSIFNNEPPMNSLFKNEPPALGRIKAIYDNFIGKIMQSDKKMLSTDWDYIQTHKLSGWPKDLPRISPEEMTLDQLATLESHLDDIVFIDGDLWEVFGKIQDRISEIYEHDSPSLSFELAQELANNFLLDKKAILWAYSAHDPSEDGHSLYMKLMKKKDSEEQDELKKKMMLNPQYSRLFAVLSKTQQEISGNSVSFDEVFKIAEGKGASKDQAELLAYQLFDPYKDKEIFQKFLNMKEDSAAKNELKGKLLLNPKLEPNAKNFQRACGFEEEKQDPNPDMVKCLIALGYRPTKLDLFGGIDKGDLEIFKAIATGVEPDRLSLKHAVFMKDRFGFIWYLVKELKIFPTQEEFSLATEKGDFDAIYLFANSGLYQITRKDFENAPPHLRNFLSEVQSATN